MDAAALTGDQGDFMETGEKNYLEMQKKKGHTNFLSIQFLKFFNYRCYILLFLSRKMYKVAVKYLKVALNLLFLRQRYLVLLSFSGVSGKHQGDDHCSFQSLSGTSAVQAV